MRLLGELVLQHPRFQKTISFFLLSLFAVVSAQAQTTSVNAIITLGSATPGATLTSSILSNGTAGSLSGWSSSGASADMTVGTHNAACTLQNTITVGGSTYSSATPSQSFAMNMKTANTFWTADYTGGKNKIAISFCLTLPTSASNVMDIVSIQDASGFTTWLQIGNGATSLDLEVTPNPTTASVPVTPGGTYWISMLDDESSGKASFAVFNSASPYAQVGTTETHSQVTSSAITAIRIGNAEAGTSSSTMFMENLLFDSTNAAFPFDPLIPASGTPPPPPPPPTSSSCDVNKDGSTNVADVQGEVNQALGASACANDINQDGVCNVVDVQRVVNAALGGQCVTTP